MARINIDNSLYTDSRFVKLCIKLESLNTALGAIVRVWTVAQKWYVKPEKDIPADEWEKQELLNDVIEVGLAVRRGDFIHVCGADEQFSWLAQRIAAGRKGGLAKSENLATAKRPIAGDKQTQASYSYSYSSIINKPQLADPPRPPVAESGLIKKEKRGKPKFDFESIYQAYPRHLGKKTGIEKAKRVITTPAMHDQLTIAVKNYAEHVKREHIEPRFVKHFSTFMTSWEDWIEPPKPAKLKLAESINYELNQETGALIWK